jgi:hypothetical protein
MNSRSKVDLASPRVRLRELLGEEYIGGVLRAKALLMGRDVEEILSLAGEEVELYPESFSQRVDGRQEHVGRRVRSGYEGSDVGAGSAAFRAAINSRMAPLSGLGFIRIGEDGRARLISKSEHYRASLVKGFTGLRLLMISYLPLRISFSRNTAYKVTLSLNRRII